LNYSYNKLMNISSSEKYEKFEALNIYEYEFVDLYGEAIPM